MTGGRKPALLGPSSVVSSKDRRKITNELASVLGCVPEQISIPTDCQVFRIQGTKSYLYSSHGKPMAIQCQNPSRIIPSLHYVWDSTAVPAWPEFVIAEEVSKFILRGADLMLPGVYNPNIESMNGEWMRPGVVGIRVRHNPDPIAIGITELTVESFLSSKMRGKAATVLHSYRDPIWQLYAKSPPNEGFLGEQVVSIGFLESHYSNEGLSTVVPSSPKSAPLDDESPNDKVASSERNPLGSNHECKEQHEQEKPEMPLKKNPVVPDDAIDATDPKLVLPQLTPEQMDLALLFSFYERMAREKTKTIESLPLDSSALFGLILADAAFALANPATQKALIGAEYPLPDDFSMLDLLNAAQLDIKRSTHKKLSKFFGHLQKKKLLTTKTNRGALSVIHINSEHKEIKDWKCIDEEERNKVDALLGRTDATAEASRNVREIRVITFFSPPKPLQGIFNAVGEPFKGAVQHYEELDPTDPLCVQITTFLSTKTAKSQEPKPDNRNMIRKLLREHHAVTHSEDDNSSTITIHRDKCPPVEVSVAARGGGRKAYTMIDNLCFYSIDESEVTSLLKVRLAASAVETTKPGSKNVKSVMVQGNVREVVCKLLREHFGLRPENLTLKSKK